MNPGPSITRSFVTVLACVAGWCHALELRTYSAARHDRFTGDPAAPMFNDSAWYGSRKYSGIGWIPGEGNSRQFALVSPCHVVFASHYYPGIGTTIRFLNSDGLIVDRTVTGTQFVLNDASLPTDLCLMKLSAPITAAEKVAHFPYLNLASESAYTGAALTVFGWNMKAGRSSIQSIQDSNISGVNATRVMQFRYRKLFGNQDDAYVVGGDSGSPTFAMAGGNPAIVGIHTAAGDSSLYFYGYDTFIPHYAGTLDVLLATDGYRMTPAYPPSVTLSTAAVVAAPLKQAYPGSCRFDLSNTGVNDGGNARFTLHFPSGSAPDSVTAPGWIAELSGPQDWVFRRGNLETGAVAQFTADWAQVPAVSSVSVEISRVADGSPSAVQTFELEPVPTFRAWASALPDPAEAGDPDQDGIPNLLEYAFGGNGNIPSRKSESGGLLLPEIISEGNTVTLRFPVREDAGTRGLSYSVEFSTDLTVSSWGAASMVLTDATSLFDPPVSGFLLRTVSWDRGETRQFVRVNVVLSE